MLSPEPTHPGGARTGGAQSSDHLLYPAVLHSFWKPPAGPGEVIPDSGQSGNEGEKKSNITGAGPNLC